MVKRIYHKRINVNMTARKSRKDYFFTLCTLKIWVEVILSMQQIQSIKIGDQSHLEAWVNSPGNLLVGSDE